ncbi:MAG: hypothetical protein HY646_19825 [Acidobacteria bacterium]|nr:hypothetical protein [Acidobacteriota bacterium]
MTDRFGLQAGASIPDVTRSAVVSQPAGTLNFSETFNGLGDTSVLAWYRLPRLWGWNAMVNAGSSLPTGKTETPRFRSELRDGSLVPMSRLQRGSGTVDPIIGINVNRRVYKGTIIAFGSLAARIPVYENKDGLRTGTSSEVNAGLAREIFTHKIVAIGRAGWVHRNQDVFRGTPVLVGGGDWLYATPGVAVQLVKGINVQVDVKIPVYRRLANMQLDSRAIFQLGMSREF